MKNKSNLPFYAILLLLGTFHFCLLFFHNETISTIRLLTSSSEVYNTNVPDYHQYYYLANEKTPEEIAEEKAMLEEQMKLEKANQSSSEVTENESGTISTYTGPDKEKICSWCQKPFMQSTGYAGGFGICFHADNGAYNFLCSMRCCEAQKDDLERKKQLKKLGY